ncbi:MAG: PH domain-containing protein [Anaerolineae bacterium]
MTDKLDFLGKLTIFEALDEDDLLALAQISGEYEFDEGAVIAFQRDVADSLIIVHSGRLYARSVDERGIVREEHTHAYYPGDYFGEKWLFAPDAHPATVKGTEKGRVILIKSDEFLQFLEKHPGVLEALEPELDESEQLLSGLSLEAWEEAQKVRLRADKRTSAISLLPDELVEFQAHRSRWYLFLRLVGPAVGMVAFLLLTLSTLANRADGGIVSTLGLIAPVGLTLFFAALLIFQYLDWANDYFVITNKHLAHHEFSLRSFRTTVDKIPIDQIQSVEIVRPTFIANLFNFGTARITTAAQTGTVYFDNIDDPGQVQETLDRLRRRVKVLDAARAQATMRQSLEKHFQYHSPYRKVEEPDDVDEEEEAETDGRISLREVWASIKKRYQWRVEENGIITYRKHFFVLLKDVMWPVLIFLILMLLFWLAVRFVGLTFAQLAAVFGLLMAIDLAWFLWQVEDWRNETFQVTDRFVIDIDRKPFGFGESRKQAELSNVQNINSDRPGLLATLFNFGNVIIETAGATADITFENVSNPNRVQSDVFKRLDQYRQRQRIREGERRREEYAVLLDVYQQAVEQEMIPRRTPPDTLPDEEDMDI